MSNLLNVQPTYSPTTHEAQSTEHDKERERIKQGQCITCGIQTHQPSGMLNKSLVPLTKRGLVLNGRCLLCKPLQVPGEASTESVGKQQPRDEETGTAPPPNVQGIQSNPGSGDPPPWWWEEISSFCRKHKHCILLSIAIPMVLAIAGMTTIFVLSSRASKEHDARVAQMYGRFEDGSAGSDSSSTELESNSIDAKEIAVDVTTDSPSNSPINVGSNTEPSSPSLSFAEVVSPTPSPLRVMVPTDPPLLLVLTSSPSYGPITEPTLNPTLNPITSMPTFRPTSLPTLHPHTTSPVTNTPTLRPSSSLTDLAPKPTVFETPYPTPQPTPQQTPQPTPYPMSLPTVFDNNDFQTNENHDRPWLSTPASADARPWLPTPASESTVMPTNISSETMQEYDTICINQPDSTVLVLNTSGCKEGVRCNGGGVGAYLSCGDGMALDAAISWDVECTREERLESHCTCATLC